MNKDCKNFYQTISESCEIISLKDGNEVLKMNELYRKSNHRMHLTVEAKSPKEVKKIHNLALISGGISDGEPKVRSFNGKFSAYIIDPEGNRIEVVCLKNSKIS